jgi:hypothetical protein
LASHDHEQDRRYNGTASVGSARRRAGYDDGKVRRVTLSTDKGDIKIELTPKETLVTVNFVSWRLTATTMAPVSTA